MPLIKFRYGVFETNSSSVHAIAVIDEDAFDAWKNYGAYLNLGLFAKSDYAYDVLDEEDNPSSLTDIDGLIIMPNDIEETRQQLPKEEYYEEEYDCLLEAGIFPFEAYTGDNGKPSQKWASLCGGLHYIDYTEEEDGYKVEAGWYKW